MSLLPTIKIGDCILPHNVVLAPMSGITDKPFRHVVRKWGGGLVVSEMIASHAFLQDVWIELQKLKGAAQDEAPLSIQIAGWDPMMMAEAARLAEMSGAQIIDINMGCPAKKVTNRLSGSALMQDERAAGAICRAVVNAVSLPVSLKMRLGWNDEHKNAPDIARIAENEGIQLLAVHGRTRTQMYKGVADWKTISKTVESVNIPVFANGDITSFDAADNAMTQSGAAGLLVGRGAMGRPWFIGQLAEYLAGQRVKTTPPVTARLDTIKTHTDEVLGLTGTRGLRSLRKHFAAYCDYLPQSDTLRASLLSATEAEDVFTALDLYRRVIDDAKAA
ncbi:MAG: tRNA dihydrouridine synthase DusB [Candidatus Puniceispirillaceae bacterium]